MKIGTVARLFFVAVVIFFGINGYACSKDGLALCRQKTIDSNSTTSQTLQIPLTGNKRLFFSPYKTPDGKIIKHDPLLALYIVENPNGFRFPFKIEAADKKDIAMVNADGVTHIKIAEHQDGVDKLASVVGGCPAPALLLSGCCALEGLATPKGIIEKEYLVHFLADGFSGYSDFGVVVDEKSGVVVQIDPFYNHGFVVGDLILAFNTKSIGKETLKEMLFCKVGSIGRFKIKRGDKEFELAVVSRQKKSGVFVPNESLDAVGIYFDAQMKIVKLKEDAQERGLKAGDQILAINSKEVQNSQDFATALSSASDEFVLLIRRDGFDFTIVIKAPRK